MPLKRIGRRTIELSNLGKPLFAEAGISKGDLVRHYERLAEVMLPHVRNRPLALERYPDGAQPVGLRH